MRIAQFYHENRLHLGSIEGDTLIPIDFNGDMLEFITTRPPLRSSGSPIPLDHVSFAPVVSRPTKIIGIGLNYLDHVRESKGEIPELPKVFAKFPSSLLAHNDQITWDPKITSKVDFEAELAVIIGKKAHQCAESEAMETAFGYTCANDVSARELQFGDGQWVRGKSLDTFCPLGPWIITSEEIPDPHSLTITCSLNGQIMQDSHTGLMIFKLPQLISFLSKHFSLLPGDVILTGTPHGVGAFRNPPVYLKHGDEVVVEIEKVGRLVNTCQTL